MNPAALLLFLPTAWAHHGTATTQASPPPLPSPVTETQQTPSVRLGLRYDQLRLNRRVEGSARDVVDEPVAVHRTSLQGAVALPSGQAFGLSMPVGWVAGTEETTVGPGDLSLWLGQGIGDAVRLQVDGGVTAPTGRYDADDVHAEIDLETSEDGSFFVATYATRTSLGGGSWSAQGRAALQATLGPAMVRGFGTVSQPLHRTPDGFRWGRDTTLGAAATSPALGPIRVEAGIDRRWHQSDRFTFVDDETDEPMERPVGGRTSTGMTLAVTGQISERLACRVDGYRLLGQQAEGIQLMASGGMGGGCQLSVPMPKRRIEAQMVDHQEEQEPTAFPADVAAEAEEPARLER